MKHLAIAVLCVFASAGLSAETLLLTINSDPQGATVYTNASETLVGYAPVTLKYKVSRDFKRKGECEVLQPIRVRWASGAESSAPKVTACGSASLKQEINFTRPVAAPGQELDAMFAIQVQQLALMQAQAKAQAEADLISQLTAAFKIPAPTTKTCYSTIIGKQVFTNCY